MRASSNGAGSDSLAVTTRKWTPERVRAELAPLLAGRSRWPYPSEFRAAGREGVMKAARAYGGAARWAREFGVAPPRRSELWTEARIRAELTVLMGGSTRWPTVAEFDAAGANLLRQALRRHGGIERWASEFGVTPRKRGRARGERLRWPDQRIQAELAALLAGRERWPTSTEFDAAGARDLCQAVRAHGGAERWARAFGLTPPVLRQRWTVELVRSELSAFLAGRERWPSAPDFRRAGKEALYSAAQRHGGLAHWAQAFGYPYPSPRRPYRWTDEGIRAELSAFLAGRAHWPSRREFIRAGKGGLLNALGQGRGIDWWAAEFGLPRRSTTSGRPARRRLPAERETRAALAVFLAGRSRFPPRSEFKQAGLDDLWLASRRYGGLSRWMREFGLRSPLGRPAGRTAAESRTR